MRISDDDWPSKPNALGRSAQNRFASLVSPNTLLAWHRRLIAQKYDSTLTRTPGRPPTAAQLQELILKLARENRSWDYPWFIVLCSVKQAILGEQRYHQFCVRIQRQLCTKDDFNAGSILRRLRADAVWNQAHRNLPELDMGWQFKRD